MGLFDFIHEQFQDALEGQQDAEDWDARRICRELSRTSGLLKSGAYMNALKSKCQEMNDRELINLFDSEANSRHTKAVSAMMSVMEERGLAYRNDNGKIVRTYR